MLFRAVLPLAPFLLAACGAGAGPNDFVLYKPAPAEVEGRLRSGTLLVTSGGAALWVEHSASGQVVMGEGSVPAQDWERLAEALLEAGGGSADTPAFQVYARIGGRVVDLAADSPEGLPRLRGLLEEIRGGLAPPDDPVKAASSLLFCPVPHVRGHAVIALLMLFRDEAQTEETRARARRALRDHLLVESGEHGDPAIAGRIRDALERDRASFLSNPRQK